MRLAMTSSSKTLKIKIISRKPDPSTSEVNKPSSRDGQGVAANRSKETELAVTAGDGKQLKSVCGTKRGPEEMIDNRGGKRLKMDRSMVRKCLLILKKLMTHQYGPVFNKPVDPVALNIPDYFSIIAKPMDLGTIKAKLEKDRYSTADEFEADIKLTFSNAMKYNPPQNPYHKMAQELNSVFGAQWRFLGSMMKRESRKGETDNGLCDREKKLLDMRSDCISACSPHPKASPRRSTLMTDNNHNMNVKGSKQEPARKVPAKNIRAIEEEKNEIRKTDSKLACSSTVSLGAKSSVNIENVCRSSMNSNVLHRRPTESTNKMEPKKKEGSIGKKVPSRMEPKKKEASIGKKVPLRNARASELKTPSSGLKTSETIGDEVAISCKPSKQCDSHPTSRGSLSWLDEEPTFHGVTAFASDDWRSPVCQTQLSPSKASRAEMLKRRFADTILKAQNKTLLCPGEKLVQGKMEVEKQRLGGHHAEGEVDKQRLMEVEKQRLGGHHAEGEVDKQRLERHHVEEKLKTEIQASRGSQRCMQHQREREAARIALEKVEKSVEFEDNISILKDLACLIGDFSFAGPLSGCGGMYMAAKHFVNGKLKSPLERLGLYLKEDDDYMFGDDQGHDRATLPEDYEEGELIF